MKAATDRIYTRTVDGARFNMWWDTAYQMWVVEPAKLWVTREQNERVRDVAGELELELDESGPRGHRAFQAWRAIT